MFAHEHRLLPLKTIPIGDAYSSLWVSGLAPIISYLDGRMEHGGALFVPTGNALKSCK
jgi:hypothetical protein